MPARISRAANLVYSCLAIALVVLQCAFAISPVQAMSLERLLLRNAENEFHSGIQNKTRILQARKHFSAAADAYLELHKLGIRSPALYRNLGNALVLADRWPEAIWAYQTGLRLDPNDRTMREHLAFARGKVIPPPSGQGRLDADVWPSWLYRPTFSDLFALTVAFYLGTCLAGAWAFGSRRTRAIWLTLGLGLIALVAGIGLAYEAQKAETDRDTPLVILAGNTPFHRGNGEGYPQHTVLPVLPRGLEVRQTHRRGAWLQVRLSTGETGWIHAGNALMVEP